MSQHLMAEVKMFGIYVVLVYLFWFQNAYALHNELTNQSNSVCFGDQANQINVACNQGEVIAVKQIFVGAVPIAGGCPAEYNDNNTDTSCCQPDDGVDCIVPFDITEQNNYAQLNGVMNRPIQAHHLDNIDCNGTFYSRTQYMYVEYNCIEVSGIYNICSNVNVSDTSVYVWNEGFPGNISSAESTCNCSIEASDTVSSIVVRTIQRVLTGNENDSCNQILQLLDGSGNIIKNWTCDNNVYNVESETVPNSFIVLNLLNTRTMDDGKFWINFEANMPGVNLTISCPPVMMSTSTSTTPSSTSSSTEAAASTTTTTPSASTSVTPATTTTMPPSSLTPTITATTPSSSTRTSTITSISTTSGDSSTDDRTDTLLIIIGTAVAALLMILIIVMVIILCCLKRNRKVPNGFSHAPEKQNGNRVEEKSLPGGSTINGNSVASYQPGDSNKHLELTRVPNSPVEELLHATSASAHGTPSILRIDKETNTDSPNIILVEEASQTVVDISEKSSQVRVSQKSRRTSTPSPTVTDKVIQTRKIKVVNVTTQCKEMPGSDKLKVDTGSQTEASDTVEAMTAIDVPDKTMETLMQVKEYIVENETGEQKEPEQTISMKETDISTHLESHQALEKSPTNDMYYFPPLSVEERSESIRNKVCSAFFDQEKADIRIEKMMKKLLSKKTQVKQKK